MKLTIRKFQKLYAINQLKVTELEKNILLIKCYTGKNDEEVDEMSVLDFNKLLKEITEAFDFDKLQNLKPKSIIKVKGRKYRLFYNLKKIPLNAGSYVESAVFAEDVIGNLHKIMATISRPLKLTWKGWIENKSLSHEERANEFLDCDFKQSIMASVFFCVAFIKLIENLNHYSIQDQETMNKVNQQVQHSIETLGGYTTLKWFQNLKI